MKKLYRAGAWLLACLLIACSVASCAPASVTPSGTTPTETPPSAPAIKGLKVGEAELRDFTIVTPATADVTEQGAAEYLKSWLFDTYAIDLPLVTDDTAPAAHEILVGATARTPAAILTAAYGKMEFASCTDGGNIVLYGPSFMSAGAVGDFTSRVLNGKNDFDLGAALGAFSGARTYTFTAEPDSVLLLIGDGHSYNHYKLALQSGALTEFAGFSFPALGYSITHSMVGITDSGAGGSALATGYKTFNGSISTSYLGVEYPSLCDVVQEKGGKTALLTDCSILDATPSVFYGHAGYRDEDEVLQAQLDVTDVDICKGDLENSALSDEMMSALREISPKDERFFLMIENGLFDTSSHGNNAYGVVQAAVEFDEMLRLAAMYTLLHPHVLLVVTADHETGGLGVDYPLNTPTYNADTLASFHTEDHSARTAPLLLLGHGVEHYNNAILDNTDINSLMAAVLGNDHFGFNGEQPGEATAALLPTVVSEGNQTDGFLYSLLSDGTCRITGAADQTLASLTVPDTLAGHTVCGIAAEAFKEQTALAEVTLPASVTYIGHDAFAGTPWLAAQTDEFVIVGGGVLLRYNGTAETVTVPSGVVCITDAFLDNKTVTSVTFPAEGLRVIGDYAFYGCRKLTDPAIPEGVLLIGDYAFYGCCKIKNLTLPQSLDAIGSYAFSRCEYLDTLTFPREMHTLGDYAFFYCPKLGSIDEMPEGLVELPAYCFSMCETLLSVNFCSTLRTIGDYCFQNDAQLNAAYMNQGLREIGEYAFQNTRLMELWLPDSLEKIGAFAFEGLEHPYSVDLPAGLTSLGESAFANCEQLLILVCRAACPIPANCFAGSGSLELIELAATCSAIGENAFGGMTAAQQLCFAGTPEQYSALLAATAAGNAAVTEAPVVYAGS